MAPNSFLKIPGVSSVTRLLPWDILSTFESAGSNLIVIIPPFLLNPPTRLFNSSTSLFGGELGGVEPNLSLKIPGLSWGDVELNPPIKTCGGKAPAPPLKGFGKVLLEEVQPPHGNIPGN